MTPQEEKEHDNVNPATGEPEEDAGSESFFARITRRLAAQVDLECSRCGEPFRGNAEGDSRCSRCSHYASVPGSTPGAFNWHQKHNDGTWTVRALWEDYRYVGDDKRVDVELELPQVGDVIDVYQRDGSSSKQVIASVGESFLAPNACRYLCCQIRPAGR